MIDELKDIRVGLSISMLTMIFFLVLILLCLIDIRTDIKAMKGSNDQRTGSP